MLDRFLLYLSQVEWWESLLKIGLYFLAAWLIQRASRRIARHLLSVSRFAPRSQQARPERQAMLESLFASAIGLLAFLGAILLSVGLFVETSTLVWMIGLLSAGFGLSARPLISDIFSGISFIFEDTYAVGEKIEVLGLEGVVEAINLRTTWLRSPGGELYVIPNGEICTVRNFSRGRFSPLTVTRKFNASDLSQAIIMLEDLGDEAVTLLPNLLEPWQVISPSGVIGQQTELEMAARARFGKAAEMRPRLLALIQERFEEAGIELVS